MEQVRVKKIFKQKLATQLLINGHELLYTEANEHIPQFSVYVFKETVELLKDLTKLTH